MNRAQRELRKCVLKEKNIEKVFNKLCTHAGSGYLE